MTTAQYKLMLRFLGAGAALIIGGISLYFSQDGFNISVPGMAWVGWLLAFAVPVIEMVWNHEKHRSMTLFVAGLAAYAYGYITNVIGLMAAQGYAKLPWDQPWLFLVPAVIGFFLEWVPEPLLQVVLVNDGETIEEVLTRGVRSPRPSAVHEPVAPTPVMQPGYPMPQQPIVFHPPVGAPVPRKR